jgi:hypothetical protein
MTFPRGYYIALFLMFTGLVAFGQECCEFDLLRRDTILRQSSISVIEVPPGKHAILKFEDIPVVIITNIIDNKDQLITYSGTWYNGNTTAEGFSSNTIAYSNIAGNSLTYQFSGTSIEVFCEKKIGMGRASFQVDSQPPVTIDLGVSGGVGLVFGAYGLNTAPHTFKLVVLDNKYVVFDQLKTTNN